MNLQMREGDTNALRTPAEEHFASLSTFNSVIFFVFAFRNNSTSNFKRVLACSLCTRCSLEMKCTFESQRQSEFARLLCYHIKDIAQ